MHGCVMVENTAAAIEAVALAPPMPRVARATPFKLDTCLLPALDAASTISTSSTASTCSERQTMAVLYCHGRSVYGRTFGGQSFEFAGHCHATAVARVSPDGLRVASADASGLVKVWPLQLALLGGGSPSAAGRLQEETRDFRLFSPSPIVDLAWSPDGSMLAACGEGREAFAVVVDSASGSPIGGAAGAASMCGPTKRCTAVAFGRRAGAGPAEATTLLAVASDDFSVSLYCRRGEGGRPFSLLCQMKHHTRFALALAFSPDATMLASGGGDGAIYIYPCTDDGQQCSLPLASSAAAGGGKQPAGSVTGLVWSADGRQITSAHADGSICRWDSSAAPLATACRGTMAPLARASQLVLPSLGCSGQRRPGQVLALACSSSSEAACVDSAGSIWRIGLEGAPEAVEAISGHLQSVTCFLLDGAAAQPQGAAARPLLYSADGEGRICSWSDDGWRCSLLASPNEQSLSISSMALLAPPSDRQRGEQEGATILATSRHGKAFVYRPDTAGPSSAGECGGEGRPLVLAYEYAIDMNEVASAVLCASPAAAGGEACSLVAHIVASQTSITAYLLAGGCGGVPFRATAAYSSAVATCCTAAAFAGGRLYYALSGSNEVHVADFGSFGASGGEDISPITGKAVIISTLSRGSITALSVSPAGDLLAIGDDQRRIHLYDLHSGTVCLPTHGASCRARRP